VDSVDPSYGSSSGSGGTPGGLVLAVLGCGSAGRRHAANAARLGCKLILYDIDRSKAEELANTLGSAGWHKGDKPHIAASVQEALQSDINGCVVASPTHLHASHVEEAIEAGIPCLVEKPLAVTTAEGRRIADLALERGVGVMVGYNLRFSSPAARARKLIQSGKLGRILLARFWFGFDVTVWRPGVDWRTTYSYREATGGGVRLEASHEFDLCSHLLGRLQSIEGAWIGKSAHLESDIEAVALALAVTSDGIPVEICLDECSPVYRRGFEIVGVDAVVSYDWSTKTFRLGERLTSSGPAGTSSSPAPQEEHGMVEEVLDPGLPESYAKEMEEFLRCLSAGEDPSPDVWDGIEALAVAEAIEAAAKSGHRVEVQRFRASAYPADVESRWSDSGGSDTSGSEGRRSQSGDSEIESPKRRGSEGEALEDRGPEVSSGDSLR